MEFLRHLNTLTELLTRYNLAILVLVETKVSGPTADEIHKKIGFDGTHRVEAQGFSGGIWLLWRRPTIEFVKYTDQFVTIEV